KEVAEEVGIEDEQIKLIDVNVFDVDIHRIDENDHEPQHDHIDIRFLVEIDDDLLIPGNDESHQVIWVELREAIRYNRNRSTYRMMEKTRMLRALL
ncbi:MAG: NUDIX domain-containing protein, partial [Gammaproteobacteria bacterium]|nr:NUDIX domain-containing protein [Gammaproteobacteria bacterium]